MHENVCEHSAYLPFVIVEYEYLYLLCGYVLTNESGE